MMTPVMTNDKGEKSHYTAPSSLCLMDEEAAVVPGLNGKVIGEACVPACSADATCPTDLPFNTGAEPKCALQDVNGKRWCALTCNDGVDECPSGSTCNRVFGWAFPGVCLYESAESERRLEMTTEPVMKANKGFKVAAEKKEVLEKEYPEEDDEYN